MKVKGLHTIRAETPPLDDWQQEKRIAFRLVTECLAIIVIVQSVGEPAEVLCKCISLLFAEQPFSRRNEVRLKGDCPLDVMR